MQILINFDDVDVDTIDQQFRDKYGEAYRGMSTFGRDPDTGKIQSAIYVDDEEVKSAPHIVESIENEAKAYVYEEPPPPIPEPTVKDLVVLIGALNERVGKLEVK